MGLCHGSPPTISPRLPAEVDDGSAQMTQFTVFLLIGVKGRKSCRFRVQHLRLALSASTASAVRLPVMPAATHSLLLRGHKPLRKLLLASCLLRASLIFSRASNFCFELGIAALSTATTTLGLHCTRGQPSPPVPKATHIPWKLVSFGAIRIQTGTYVAREALQRQTHF